MGEETSELTRRMERMKAARERKAAVDAAEAALWERVILLAKGCADYGGGHRGECAEAFQHGIWTVGNVLERAREQGATPDLQLLVLERYGADRLAGEVAERTAERDEARRVLTALRGGAQRAMPAETFKRPRCPNEHPEVATVSATARGCLGCKTWGKDVMVSFGTRYDDGVQHHDFFLTTEQAQRLLDEVGRVVRANEVPDAG